MQTGSPARLLRYSPSHVRAVRDLGGQIRVTWVRRTRIDGDSWDFVEVPLGEESETYILRVLRAGAVLREVTVQVPEWIYGTSAQAADGTVASDEIYVAQVSSRYGPGPFSGIGLTGV